jgi:hypothetical protein
MSLDAHDIYVHESSIHMLLINSSHGKNVWTEKEVGVRALWASSSAYLHNELEGGGRDGATILNRTHGSGVSVDRGRERM